MLKLVKKINAIDTSGLIKKTDFDAKMKGIKGDVPSIAGLATTAVLNAGLYKMPGANNLVIKKEDYDAKVSDVYHKHFTTSDNNKFKNSILDVKMKRKKLVNVSNISGFVKNTDLDGKIKKLTQTKKQNKTKQNKKNRIKSRVR